MIASSKRDATITAKLFEENGFKFCFCDGLNHLCDELQRGCGVTVLSPDVFIRENVSRLVRWLDEQPKWSNLPVVFVAHRDDNSTPVLYEYGNVTILQQPLHIVTLLSAIRSGLASRQKQYELRDLLAQEAKMQTLLREADQHKDNFIAMIAHELRNPLSPLKSALQLMEMSEDDQAGTIELRGIMSRQVDQMVRIVEDLLDVSRISTGKLQVVRNPFNLIDSVKSGVEAARPFIEQSNQTLYLQIASKRVPVNGDPARLAQVTANILNNAAKYTPDGGNIWLSVICNSASACIEVRDDGIGMTPEEISSVFEMFRQHDVASERGKAGLGIGLTLVKSLVEMHEGSIAVTSEGKDRGSTFTVTLPTCSETAGDVTAPTRVPPRPDIRCFRVLIVDDTRVNCMTLDRLLKSMGQKVVTASNGAEAVEIANDFLPEVIISDIGMPVMDGYELAKQIRQDSRFAATKLVALTGYSQDKDRQLAIDNGFDEHMSKPVDVRDLRALFTRLSQ